MKDKRESTFQILVAGGGWGLTLFYICPGKLYSSGNAKSFFHTCSASKCVGNFNFQKHDNV